jgi:ABC-type uncharacterized transport system substrate-binding protein
MWFSVAGCIVTLTLSLLASPLTADAQPAQKVYRIGFLGAGRSPAGTGSTLEVLRQGLCDLGYVEGHNLVIEARWAEGQFGRFPDLAAELVRLKVDVIVASGGVAADAARQATETIPIVMTSGDPVAQELVASLARPGGNVTGVITTNVELSQKRLEIFKEVRPRLSQVAVLWCPGSGRNLQQLRETQGAAQALDVQLLPFEVRGPDDFEALVEAVTKERVDGLVVLQCAIMPREIAALATQHRLPAMYPTRNYVADGGLMSYGPSSLAMRRRIPVYVDKILKGAKPADLPVEQPMKFELVINLKAAKALGLTVPATILFQADEVLQ